MTTSGLPTAFSGRFSTGQSSENCVHELSRRVWIQLHCDSRARPFLLVDEVDVQRVLQWSVTRMIIRDVDLFESEPSTGTLAATRYLHGLKNASAHYRLLLALLLQILFKE